MGLRVWWKRLLNRPWMQGNPLIHVAVMAQRQRAFDWLVRVGADPAVRDGQGMTILHTAVLQPKLAEALPFLNRALAAGIDVNDRDNDGYTPLHLAVFHERPEIVAWLLDRGANLRARTAVGTTPLRHAVRWRRVMATRALLEAGAFVDERDTDGETPLLEATINPEMAEMLIGFGADLHAVNHVGDNLLHLASARANPDMVRWALGNGVNQNARNAAGRTPLQSAQTEIQVLFGGLDGLRKAFASPEESRRPAIDGQAAGNWTLVLSMLGHPGFAAVGES